MKTSNLDAHKKSDSPVEVGHAANAEPDLIRANDLSETEAEKEERNDHERREILKRYRLLLRKAKGVIKDDSDTKKIRKAFDLALKAHGGVRRKSGEPYIYHPLEVARIVVEEMGLRSTSIVCALLHDVVEDTDYNLDDIENMFGAEVARIIDGLTKVKNFKYKASANPDFSEQAENFRKVLLTITEDIRVVLIKIADRLHNMRTLESMSREKQLRIKSETEYIYAPLAHRLGLYNVKSELEDLCLKYSDPLAYEEITRKLKETERVRERFVKHFVKPIEDNLNRLGFVFDIKSRVKSVFSIYSKMKKQSVTFEEVYDLFAIRIIFESNLEEEKANCWRLYSAITDSYQPSPKRLRDWVSYPKANGYESLHTTVMSDEGRWVEVQIRSRRMDEIAEKGLAAHWKYKSKGLSNSDRGVELWLKKIRETLDNPNSSAIDLINDFRSNLFNKEVYVFTPKGELKTYPAQATVLDFAFDIHTEIGANCMGAKVNGRLVSLDYQLTNGDQVEILTSTKPKINDGWLKYVTTSRAKTKIRDYLKNAERKVAKMGKEIIERKLNQIKLPFNAETISKMVDYFSVKNETELFLQVGKGAIEHTQIKKFREVEDAQANDPKKVALHNAKEFKEIKKQKGEVEDFLIIGDDSDLEYILSPCCNPVAGDEIFGITTLTRGIRVHRTNCPNAVDMMAKHGDRIIKTRWASDTKKLFEISFNIIGTDRVGLVNDITRMLTLQKVNITAIHFETRNGMFEGSISMGVHDTYEVENTIRLLYETAGVVKVNRYDV